MISPPTFLSEQGYVSRRGDAGFWRPYVNEILKRHDLHDCGVDLEAGVGSTYPAFLCGDVAVKLFGYRRWWRQGHAAEQAAHAVLATDPQILAPRLLATGRLFDNADSPWPYLIVERTPGIAWFKARLAAEQRLAMAAALGRQIRRIHKLGPVGIARHEAWPELDVATAAERSSLPAHLVAQIDDFLARLGPFDPVFVNGDMIARHLFLEDGRLTAIIDWGDATVTDRHYELAKLHLETFAGDKELLRAFLEASDWPVADDFAHKALAHALYRQAYGLVQHHSMDVFYQLPSHLSLQEIETLDELAIELFGI